MGQRVLQERTHEDHDALHQKTSKEDVGTRELA